MSRINIEIKNSDKILRAFKRSPEIMAKGLQKGILQLGAFTAGEVKRHITTGTDMWKSPIDTGIMRRLIHIVQSGELRAIIKSSDITPYALYVHEGTRFMRARPFFEITVRRSEKQIEDFFQKRLDNIVNDITKLTR